MIARRRSFGDTLNGDTMIAGATSTMPATPSGCCTNELATPAAPRECPTSTTAFRRPRAARALPSPSPSAPAQARPGDCCTSDTHNKKEVATAEEITGWTDGHDDGPYTMQRGLAPPAANRKLQRGTAVLD